MKRSSILLVLLCSLANANEYQSLGETLHIISQRWNISFTLEFLASKETPNESWNSIKISSEALPKTTDILEWNIKRLESCFSGYIVIGNPLTNVFHCIDRSLILRSPMDESISKINFVGSSSEFLLSTSFPYPAIKPSKFIGVGSALGVGCKINLNDFSGRIRDAITVSTKNYEDTVRLMPSIQWIVECRDNNGLIRSSLYFPLGRLKPKNIDQNTRTGTFHKGNPDFPPK